MARNKLCVSHDSASPNHPHPIEFGLDEIGERALGEHPPLTSFTSAPRLRHRRSRHHRHAVYNLVGAELAQ